MPGTDIAESVRAVVGELPELPFLPQLPARGGGADPVGRSVALLVDIWAEVEPSGWRIARRPTRDVQRAKDFLAWDLDALEEHAAAAGMLKVQFCGPLTLGAQLEVPNGNRVLTDPGALEDLTASLVEGLRTHLAELRRRLPGTAFVLQLDEPDLVPVLAGELPTASGLATVRALGAATARTLLSSVLDVAADCRTVLNVEFAALGFVGGMDFDAVTVDFQALGKTAADLDRVGELVNAGHTVLAGVVPAVARGPARKERRTLSEQAAPLLDPLRALGFDAATIAAQVIPTPVDGLADADQDRATRVLRRCRELGRLLADGREPIENG